MSKSSRLGVSTVNGPSARRPERRLPIQPKRHPRETDESFLRRLLDANHVPSAARRRLGSACPPSTLLAMLSPNRHIMTTAEEDQRRLDDQSVERRPRWMCRLCAHGDDVELRPHLGNNVCLRHRLWIGPDTPPAEQCRVSAETMRAELIFRRLRARGRLNDSLYTALRDAFGQQYSSSGVSVTPREQERYPALMHLISRVVLNQELIHRVLDPTTSFRQGYATLRDAIQAALSFDAVIVVDRVWLLLRPTIASVRHQVDDQQFLDAQLHPEISLLNGYTPPSSIPRPLQPFDHYLAQRRSCAAEAARDSAQLYVIRRDDDAKGMSVVMCIYGHLWEKRRWAGIVGCPFCGNDRPLPGFNTISQTDPARLWEWHPTRNESLTPDDVTRWNTVTLVWWQCGNGHEFRETPRERLRRRGCPYCRHARIVPSVNSLAAARPDIAAEWHPQLNDTTSDKIGPGTKSKFHWLCPNGHPYVASVDHRVRNGSGCPKCRGRRIIDGATLAQMASTLTSRVDTKLVDPATVRATSTKPVRWICPDGHSYLRPPYLQRRRRNCPVCAALARPRRHGVPGQSDWKPFTETHPQLAAEWDTSRNGRLSPGDFAAGSHDIVWWTCPQGHAYPCALCYRARRGQTCPICSGRRRLEGYNDLPARCPEIAAEWDNHKNPTPPSGIGISSEIKVHWLCRYGHARYACPRQRIRTGGCPKCPKNRRAGVPLEHARPVVDDDTSRETVRTDGHYRRTNDATPGQ